MSYILDALKKSEQARGNRKRRGLIEEPVAVTVIPSSQPRENSSRWPYIVVFTLLLNAGFFVFWLRPWQWGPNANVSSSRISGGQIPETRRQETSVIPPATNAPGPDAVTAVSAGPPVSAPQTHKTVQDQIKDKVAVKKPDGSKLPQNPKAAETKKGLKTADLEATGKNQAVRVEQPLRPAAGSGIMSDIQPLAELGESSGKPAALKVPRLHELAPQIRDALPNLSVSMLVYSKKPEDRWININGSKKRQGETISEGLKLEEITPDGAIFSYQGHRFYKSVVGD
jgi:general secretion pathway protein B